jgi:hypothetical protein
MKNGARQILGKTIRAVCIKRQTLSVAKMQLFLTFTDGSVYEFYTDGSGIVTRMHRYLRSAVKFYEVKIDTLNLRVSPSSKLALKAAADHERRSMVNMLEVLVAGFCESKGIALPAVQMPRERASSKLHVEAGE